MTKASNIIELAEKIYMVGSQSQAGGLNCNPYLLVDGDEAVLFDPGSVLEFKEIYENIIKIVPLEKVKYAVLHHQDPDICSGLPLFEKASANFKLVTHWRTRALVQYYGVQSEYYIVNEHNYRLVLQSGRELRFITTPYLHFPGAIVTYDTKSKILFSSDLFGSFSNSFSFYADETYVEKMKAFHEHYMPANEILRPVMEIFLNMDISLIAPQHGSIIKENPQKYIRVLRELECGAFMHPVRKSMAKTGAYSTAMGLLLKRMASIFDTEDVQKVLSEIEIKIDWSTFEVIDYNCPGHELWNKFFNAVYMKKGIEWLLLSEPLLQKLIVQYELPLPDIYQTLLKEAEGQTYQLNTENIKLKEMVQRLEDNVRETQEKLTKCPITGLYNENFFKSYLHTELDNLKNERSTNLCLLIIKVDNITKIEFSYGDNEVKNVLQSIAYILNEIKEESHLIFRMQNDMFAYYLPDSNVSKALVIAEEIRNYIASSKAFIEKVTVSLGVAGLEEIVIQENTELNEMQILYRTAVNRVYIAQKKGMNMVCSQSAINVYQEKFGTVLIIDNDTFNVDVLQMFLENSHYKVLVARDGEEGLELANREVPDLIISEIMLPKLDGFLLRRKLLKSSEMKRIPFIFVSHLKTEESIQQANSLNVEHYYKKPYMLSELMGLIKNKVKGEAD